MFLSNLNYEQRKNFLGLATEILSVDGGIDVQEENYLRGLYGEMSLSRGDAAVVSKNLIASLFEDKEVKQAVILELMGLA